MSLMIMNPVARSIHGSTSAPTFDINSIFANGEQGVQLEPWDLTTMFQDSAGTIPVTAVGQPVGLRLDKSKGLVLGTEKVTDGTFSDALNWTAGSGWTVASGVATRIAGTAASLDQEGRSFLAGALYQIEFDVSGFSGAGGVTPTIAGVQTNSGPLLSGDGHKKCFILSTAANTKIRLTANSGVNCTIANLTVKQLLGNHAYQTTATKRPIYNGFVDFDGIDDDQNVVFPDLGSDVTIARAVPGVGVSILTGQTIGAGTWAFNTDDNGLIIVNRALTPAETAGVTAYLNARI